jgi:spore coat protein U-like protein
MRALKVIGLVLAAIVCFSGRADAANCSVSTTPVAFGSYDVFTPTATSSVGSVAINCNGNVLLIGVAIDEGRAGTFSPRRLYRTPTEWLTYNLYRDAGLATVWGDGTGGTGLYIGFRPSNNQTYNVPVYGSIPAGQDVRAGTYSDNLSVTVNF